MTTVQPTLNAYDYERVERRDDFVVRNLPSVARSDGTIQKFDPDKVLSSLLQETSIPRQIANRVTREIVVVMLNSGHSVVTAPFIREQLCSILYRENPKWRYEYTRLGMPYHDFKTISIGFFESIDSSNELDEEKLDEIISTLDKKTLKEIVRRMASDYVGVRNLIRGEPIRR